jgi:signal transduction histidine kinase
MTRGAASARPARRPEPGPEERLALLAFLLACEDTAEMVGRCLEWLREHAGVREGRCLLLDVDRTRLIHLAARGVLHEAANGFTLDLGAREHPLVRVLSASQPVVLSRETTGPLFSGRPPVLAMPLHGIQAQVEAPTGLLLVRPVTAHRHELAWASEYLGYRLARARMKATSVEAERRLRRERDLLHSVLDRVTDPIMLTDTEGRMVIANARAERLFATREGESEACRRAVAINNILFSSALGRSAVEPLTSEPRELALVEPTEGSNLLFELISTTAGDARIGMGIVSILRNVSDFRRATEETQENYRKLRAAEAEVRAERDRLDLVIDSVADPILVTDPSGNLVMMNTPAERLFSTSENAGPAETQRVQANDAHFTSFVSNLLFGKTGQSKYHGSVNLVDPKTGQPVPVEAVSGKVYGDSAEVSAIVTILHDRTEAIEREQLYERLKAASAQLERRVQEATSALVHQNELLRRQAIELEQASVAKSQFLANVSHDVRTPLNAILGYTSLLLRGVSGPLGPAQRESLARIDANGRHLLTLINEILDISRIEAGKMPVRLSSIKLNELVDEIMSEVEPLIARSNLVVTANVQPGLAPIRSDRQKVKQILLNLLTNALKFTPRGSVTVSCTHQRSTRELAIAVADTGIGIAEADQARIFEAFSQADPALTREAGGAGLRLSISRRLAAVLGGRITLESKLRQGSTFTLILPLGSKR